MAAERLPDGGAMMQLCRNCSGWPLMFQGIQPSFALAVPFLILNAA
jgi:hypothetical protein